MLICMQIDEVFNENINIQVATEYHGRLLKFHISFGRKCIVKEHRQNEKLKKTHTGLS